jgi:L-cysteine S-thiosulfotransferase
MKRQRITMAGLALAVLLGTAARADDRLIDPATPNKTIYPIAVPNTGKVKYLEHRRDLSQWPSLSYEDKRPTPQPQKVSLSEPLAGDAERGRKIAMNTQQGNCWACHALPGDAQPGVGGPPLLNFKTRGYSDAQVYQQIFDARIANAQTLMPPYGSFGTLKEQDIRDITAFLQSIE